MPYDDLHVQCSQYACAPIHSGSEQYDCDRCRFSAGAGDYGTPASTLFAIQLFLMSWVEFRRLQDMKQPGEPPVPLLQVPT